MSFVCLKWSWLTGEPALSQLLLNCGACLGYVAVAILTKSIWINNSSIHVK